LRKLWKEFNKKKLDLTQEFFYRLLYSLAKMGVMFLVRLSNLMNDLSKMKIIKDQKLVDFFQTTTYYT
jgi:hypothetical protein